MTGDLDPEPLVLDPEALWEMLLSRDPARVRAAWNLLGPDERAAVRAHLERMSAEEGWVKAQRDSAQAALDLLDSAPQTPPAAP